MTFHGHPRYTGDLDVWVAIDSVNAARVEQTLNEFGFGRLFKPDDFTRPGYAIQLGRPPYRIDILTSIDAVDFEAAYKHRKVFQAEGLTLSFIGLAELLANKRATGRPHDLGDAEKLETGIRPREGASKVKRTRGRR